MQVATDRRPHIEEPPPVKLVSIADVVLVTPTGIEKELDSFYVELLQFDCDETGTARAYVAENFTLRFQLVEGLIERGRVRPQGIEVPSLADVERKLLDREMEYTRLKGLLPGQECILLRDPAGNWIEVIESRAVR